MGGPKFELRRRCERSPYWQVVWWANGKQHERSTGERGKRAAQIIAKAIVCGAHAARSQRRELAVTCDEWLVELQRQRSEQWYRKCQTYTDRWCDEHQTLESLATDDAVRRLARDRLRTRNATTVRKELSALRRFLAWCRDVGYLAAVPVVESPSGKTTYSPKRLTREQVEAVLLALPTRHEHHGPKGRQPVREYHIVAFASGGLRKSTLHRLRWDDVDLDARTIRIRASADKKRYDRTVPMADAVHDVLSEWHAEQAEQGVEPIGLIFGERNFLASLKTAAAKAGIDPADVNLRTLRRSWLTDVCGRTKNLTGVMHIAGHKHLSTTARYVGASYDAAAALFDDLGISLGMDATSDGQDEKASKIK